MDISPINYPSSLEGDISLLDSLHNEELPNKENATIFGIATLSRALAEICRSMLGTFQLLTHERNDRILNLKKSLEKESDLSCKWTKWKSLVPVFCSLVEGGLRMVARFTLGNSDNARLTRRFWEETGPQFANQLGVASQNFFYEGNLAKNSTKIQILTTDRQQTIEGGNAPKQHQDQLQQTQKEAVRAEEARIQH